jgi:hypothetical protein
LAQLESGRALYVQNYFHHLDDENSNINLTYEPNTSKFVKIFKLNN